MLLFGGSAWVSANQVMPEETGMVSLDAAYSEGGFGYTVSPEDFEEIESEVNIGSWESDGSSIATFTSAEQAMAAAFDKYEAIVEFPTSPDAPYRVAKADVDKVVNGFLNANPQYFYIDKISYVSASGYVRRLIITYTDTVSNLQKMRGEYEIALNQALCEVDLAKMSQAEVCVILHDYLVNHINYNENASYRYTAYGALVYGEAVCQGYALAYQDLLKRAGIPAITVASDSMNHAWNMVKLGALYYHVDVTWDDTATLPGQVRHRNLLLSKNAIEATGHTGYGVSDSIYNGTGNTYDQAYWRNVQSAIYYHDNALYYLYPTDIEGANIDLEALTASHQLLFVKKPLDVNATNVNLMQYVYADISIQPEDVTEENREAAKKRLKSAYNRIREFGYLSETTDAWYINTVYGVYKVDKLVASASAASVSADEVCRWKDTDQAVYGMATEPETAFVVGLVCKNNVLYYKLDGGNLTEVPSLVLTKPAADRLCLYDSQKKITLSVGERYQIMAKLLPSESGEAVVYEIENATENSRYISITGTGLVTAHAYTANPIKIYVKNATGDITDYLSVSVENTAPTQILISNTSLTRTIGDEKQLIVSVLPGNASDKSLTFVSYDEKVATVDESGLVRMVGVGVTKIKVSLANYPDVKPVYCQVKVQILPVEVKLSNNELTLEKGQTQKLAYSFLPGDTSETGVTFTSSNKKVATVSANGTVTAVAPGEATITVKCSANTAVKATCKITVTSPKTEDAEVKPETPVEEYVDVTGVKVNTSTLSMTMVSEKKLTATIYPANASIQKIIWSSSDRRVVTVKSVSDSNSLQAIVIPEGIGSAQITATTVDGAYVARVKVTVAKKSIAKATVAKVSNRAYTGKNAKPSPAIRVNGKKLKKNVDYKISYKNNKKMGKATIIFKGIGNYKGTKKVTFQIVPRMPGVTVGKPTKHQVRIAIKKVSEAEGYQIIYATNKTFTKNKKTIWIKNNKATIQTIKNLKAKKTYYIKIRSYKKVDGKRLYSNVKLVTVKTAAK